MQHGYENIRHCNLSSGVTLLIQKQTALGVEAVIRFQDHFMLQRILKLRDLSISRL
jgi:hypothetical protein